MTGHWTRKGSSGLSIAVFESEDAANARHAWRSPTTWQAAAPAIDYNAATGQIGDMGREARRAARANRSERGPPGVAV